MATSKVSRRALMLGAVAAVAGTAAAGCGADDDPSGRGAPAAGSGSLEEVSVLTGVGFQGRESPLAVGIAQGMFAQAGLKVTVLPGKGTTENLKLLKSGAATFATLDVSGLIIARTKDNITEVKLTSILHQRNLACFMALPSSGINTPRDLAGKRITFIPGGINFVLWDTYAKLAGLPNSKVQWRQAGPTQNGPLLAQRQVDAISQFVPGRVAVELVTKQTVNVLPFTDVMTDIHGSAIGVTDETATGKASMVKRFNHALYQAVRYTLDNPAKAADIYLAQPQAKTQPRPAVLGEIQSLAGYVRPIAVPGQPTPPLGHFNADRVARNIAILQGAGQIPAGLIPEQIVAFDLAGDPVE